MPRILDHVDLRVRDLRACRDFYHGLLPLVGFTLRMEIPGWIQFEGAGSGVTEFFGVTEDPGHRPNKGRIAFWAESKDRLDRIARELPGLGAAEIEGPDWESATYYAIYFSDPSGNPLEICHRTRKLTDET